MKHYHLFKAAAFAVTGFASASWSQLYLVPLAADQTSSSGFDLSDDGRTLVGAGIGTTSVGFRFTVAGGRQDFVQPWHTPFTVSANGGRSIGNYLEFVNGGLRGSLYRESPAGEIEYIGPPLNSVAAMDANGTAITGYGALEGGRREAVIWDEAGGYRPLQHLTQTIFSSEGRDMTADGRTIVGDFNIGLAQFPMVWREETGMVGLPLPSPGYEGAAGAVSQLGNLIAGRISLAANDDRLAIWRGGGAPQLFDALLSDEFPKAATEQGMVVGNGIQPLGGAWVWTEEMGKVSLRDYAAQFGVTFDTSFYLRTCESVSADGRVFAGSASFPDGSNRAYMLVVPAPGAAGVALVSGLVMRRRIR